MSTSSVLSGAQVSEYPLSSTQQSTLSNTPAHDSAPEITKVSAVPEDKVELSAAAQAKQLEDSGQSVAQIASALALTTKTVDDYLGITTTNLDAQLLAVKVAPSR
jgi:hypothetical protein